MNALGVNPTLAVRQRRACDGEIIFVMINRPPKRGGRVMKNDLAPLPGCRGVLKEFQGSLQLA